MAPCISSKQGGGEKTKELNVFMRFLGAVVMQVSLKWCVIIQEQLSTMIISLH